VLSADVYRLEVNAARVVLNSGEIWPVDLRRTASVVVRYVAGYGAATAVPQLIKTSIMMHVTAMYDNRAACDMPATVRGMLDQFRVMDRLVSYG
jgi:uncharacterized phiE125 gp8 family phage protein